MKTENKWPPAELQPAEGKTQIAEKSRKAEGEALLRDLPSRADAREWRHFFLLLLALCLLLFLLAYLNLGLGSLTQNALLSPAQIWEVFRQGAPDASPVSSSVADLSREVIWKIRLPRLLAAAVLGGALGLSGYLMQQFFRNPIAGPFVLGISANARLFVAIVILFAFEWGFAPSGLLMVLAAFLGALLAMGLVMLLARGLSRPGLLIVSGVMLGYIGSAVTDILLTFADDARVAGLHAWNLGSFSGVNWEQLRLMSTLVLLCTLAAFLLAKPLAAYRLGEAYAHNSGVPLRRFRLLLLALASLLAATVTAFAGPVSFVGMATPHLLRGVLRRGRPLQMIPAVFLAGACFCLGADLLARQLFRPVELNLSTVTAVLGAPVVIRVLYRRHREV